MASEYDALLDEAPAASEYDALLDEPQGVTATGGESIAPTSAGSIPAPATPEQAMAAHMQLQNAAFGPASLVGSAIGANREIARDVGVTPQQLFDEGQTVQQLAFGPASPMGATIAANRALSPPRSFEPTAGIGDAKLSDATPLTPDELAQLPPDDPRRVRAVKSFADLWKLYRETEQKANTSGTDAAMSALAKVVPSMGEESGGAGLAETMRTAEGMISSQNAEIAGLGAAAPFLTPVIGALFGIPAAKSLIAETGPEVGRAYQEHGVTSPEFGKAISKGGAELLIAAGGFGGLKGEGRLEARAHAAADRMAKEFIDQSMDDLLAKPVEDLLKPSNETRRADKTDEPNIPDIRERTPEAGDGVSETSQAAETAPSSLTEVWNRFQETETDTPRDLAREVNDMIGSGEAPESLREPLNAYVDAMKDDFENMAGRGDVEPFEKAFLDAVGRAAGESRKATEAPVESASGAVDLSPIQSAKTKADMFSEGGRLLAEAKTDAELQAIQKAMKEWNPPEAKPSPLAGPALKPSEGEPLKGQIGEEHGQMKIDAAKRGEDFTDAEHGFHDKDGNFLTRLEGTKRALDTGLITKEQYDEIMARTDAKGEPLKDPGMTSQDLKRITEAKAQAEPTTNEPDKFDMPSLREALGEKLAAVESLGVPLYGSRLDAPPAKPGHVRLFHGTDLENLKSIGKKGIVSGSSISEAGIKEVLTHTERAMEEKDVSGNRMQYGDVNLILDVPESELSHPRLKGQVEKGLVVDLPEVKPEWITGVSIGKTMRVGKFNNPVVETAAFKYRQKLKAGQAEPPKGMSEGPGAAASTEPLVSYEKRRFGERFQESEDISPEVREATGNRYYEPIPNKVTVAEAENIIEQRGTDEGVRLVRDESFPMDHRVRSTMAQGLIKKLNQSHAEAVKAGDTKAAEGFLNQAVDTAEFLSELGTKLGQGVQSFAIWSRLTPEGRLMAVTRRVKKARMKTGKADLTPEEKAELTKLSADIEAAPEGFQRNEKTADFLAKVAELEGASPADIPTAIWYANILSGYTTQLVNTLDTALNVFSESAAMAASHPSAVPDILSGLYRGMVKGGFEAAAVLKTGKGKENKLQVPPILERTKFGEKGGVPVSTDTAVGRLMKAGLEKKPAAILNLWKYPLRAMVASDSVFYNSFKEARSRVLARAMAKTEGLRGDALFRRVDEILNETPESVAAAEKQATDEGLTGLRYKRRVKEIAEQGRPEELVSNADEAAAIATYNHDPSGTLGMIASKISEVTQNAPLTKAIVPFTRIVANVANRGLDYTPWGYKRLFFGRGGGERFSENAPVGEAYRTQLIKATAGTVGMTALAAMDAANTIQLTASGPEDPNERKQLMNSGWKPYSVKIGDTWYSYQYTPLNLGLAMVGHYRDAVRYNKLSEKDAQTRLAYGMLKSGSTLFDMSFLSGLSDFMETVSGKMASSKSAGKMLARTASSVVIPNLVKQVDKLFDPTLYDAETVQQALIRETPVARSTMLKPVLNVLGEPVQLNNNRFFSTNKNDPVWKLIVDKQAFISIPSKTTKINDRPITPEEYHTLIRDSGKQIREYIEGNLSDLQEMDAGAAQDAISKEANKIRAEVKKGLQ